MGAKIKETPNLFVSGHVLCPHCESVMKMVAVRNDEFDFMTDEIYKIIKKKRDIDDAMYQLRLECVDQENCSYGCNLGSVKGVSVDTKV